MVLLKVVTPVKVKQLIAHSSKLKGVAMSHELSANLTI